MNWWCGHAILLRRRLLEYYPDAGRMYKVWRSGQVI